LFARTRRPIRRRHLPSISAGHEKFQGNNPRGSYRIPPSWMPTLANLQIPAFRFPLRKSLTFFPTRHSSLSALAHWRQQRPSSPPSDASSFEAATFPQAITWWVGPPPLRKTSEGLPHLVASPFRGTGNSGSPIPRFKRHRYSPRESLRIHRPCRRGERGRKVHSWLGFLQRLFFQLGSGFARRPGRAFTPEGRGPQRPECDL